MPSLRIKEKNRSGEQGERLGSEPPSTEYLDESL